MTLKFTPPREEAQARFRYATYVSGSGMKVFGDLGSAKLSLYDKLSLYAVSSYYYPSQGNRATTKAAQILELVDGEWFTLFDIPEGSTYITLPWVKKFWKHKKYGWHRDYFPTYNPEEYEETYRAVPMTRDEYAQWRLAVEREKVAV